MHLGTYSAMHHSLQIAGESTARKATLINECVLYWASLWKKKKFKKKQLRNEVSLYFIGYNLKAAVLKETRPKIELECVLTAVA